MNPFEVIKPTLENRKLYFDKEFTVNWKPEYFSMYFFFKTAVEKYGSKYDYSKVTYKDMLDKILSNRRKASRCRICLLFMIKPFASYFFSFI